MGIFSKLVQNKKDEKKKDVSDSNIDIPTPSQVGERFVNEVESNVKDDEQIDKKYLVSYAGKKHRVIAKNEAEAVEKVKNYYKKVDNAEEAFNITIEDIFNAISDEVTRIVTVAHPETVNNNYDRWIAVLTEELGEIVHEVNDEYEGKKANKNLYVECIQLCAATTLLAKKFAEEHPEMFEDK